MNYSITDETHVLRGGIMKYIYSIEIEFNDLTSEMFTSDSPIIDLNMLVQENGKEPERRVVHFNIIGHIVR